MATTQLPQKVPYVPPQNAGPVPHQPGNAGPIGNQFLVRAVNNEEVPIKVKWDSIDYWLQPGQDAYIPTPCAWLFFGDPRATDVIQAVKDGKGIVAYIPDRAAEVRRLRIKWGAGIEGDDATFDQVNIPDVQIFSVTGEEITTVLQDPLGVTIMPASTTVSSDEALRELVAQQQQQIAALTQHLGLTPESTANNEADLPNDDDVLPPGVVDLTNGGKE